MNYTLEEALTRLVNALTKLIEAALRGELK